MAIYEDFGEEFIAERLTSAEQSEEESEAEVSLRPTALEDFTGQESVKEQLRIAIDAAKIRGEALEHVLLFGPPGLGKTTLSQIIANEMGTNIQITSGPAIEKSGDLLALLTNLGTGDVLFIDEIHRLPKTLVEMLYSAMEDKVVDIFIGSGPSARSIRMSLKSFTLIGATTRAGQLSQPLRARFGHVLRLELYTPEELSVIIRRSAGILGIEIDDEGAMELASRSRGTPRIANRLLRRVRDYAQIKGDGKIDKDITKYALQKLDIDNLGLDSIDRRMLTTIIKFYGGGPVGMNTLAATIGEEAVTLEDVYEPYLLQIGFISRTTRGRCCTYLAYEHLGIPMNKDENKNGQLTAFDGDDK